MIEVVNDFEAIRGLKSLQFYKMNVCIFKILFLRSKSGLTFRIKELIFPVILSSSNALSQVYRFPEIF